MFLNIFPGELHHLYYGRLHNIPILTVFDLFVDSTWPLLC